MSSSSGYVPDGSPTTLRLGIMANGTRFPAWQAAVIRSLMAVPGVEVALLLVPEPGSGAARSRRSKADELLADRRHLLWNVFNKGFVERRSRASRPVDLGEELAEVPVMRCRTVAVGRFGEAFSDDDVAAVAGHDLDVLLRFAFGIVKGDILVTPRFGVWSFHHGDERSYRGRPPGFWEMVEGSPVVGSILQRLTERLDGGIVLHRGVFATVPHSYVRTRDDAFLGSSDWPATVCRAIVAGDTAAATAAPSSTDAAVRLNPRNGVMARFLVRQGASYLAAQWRGLTSAAIWSVGVAEAPPSAFLEHPPPPIRWLGEAGTARYLADPGAVGSHPDVALVEDYDHRTHRGVISAVALDGPARPRMVIDTGVHASYPYVFEADGAIWCAPETYQLRQLRLYRATRYPDAWEHVTTPIDGVAVLDATVWRHGDRWWIFGTDHDDGPNTKLRVWFADDLLGEWQPHPLNPVKTDVRSSRPAGTPFMVDGALYRPAQDSSTSYGGAITINRIDVLTPTAFSEQPVATVTPPTSGRYRAGIHTLTGVGHRTIVDGRRDTFVWSAFRRELAGRLGKLRRRRVGRSPGTGSTATDRVAKL